MMDNIKIDRINALAHKQKSVGLTEERKGGTGEASERISGCSERKISVRI